MRFGYTWVLLHWKVKVFKRPTYFQNIKVKTWAGFSNRFYTLRDFEIYDENDDLICLASSKWVLIDLNTNSISKITPNIIGRYESENKSVFDENDIAKIISPKISNTPCYTFKVLKRDIDVNGHMHNINYLDYALETLPEKTYSLEESNEFEIMYKSGAKLGNKVDCYYVNDKNLNYIIMKNSENSQLHAIIKFIN